MAKKIPIRPFITAAIVLSISVYFIRICYEGLDQQYLENDWQITQGAVLSPEVELTDPDSIARKRQGIEQALNYEYRVGNKTYRSNSVSPEGFLDATQYPEGAAVEVYYDPDNPTQTVLIRTPVQTQYLWGMMVACIAVIFVTIFSLIRDIKNAE